MENLQICIGDIVAKKSGKPFASKLKQEIVVSLGFNNQDPQKRPCAVFADGSSCNIDILIKIES